jgi:hypothetical protein
VRSIPRHSLEDFGQVLNLYSVIPREIRKFAEPSQSCRRQWEWGSPFWAIQNHNRWGGYRHQKLGNEFRFRSGAGVASEHSWGQSSAAHMYMLMTLMTLMTLIP